MEKFRLLGKSGLFLDILCNIYYRYLTMHNSVKSVLLALAALVVHMIFFGGFIAGVLALVGIYFGYKAYNAKVVQIPLPFSVSVSGKKGKSVQVLVSSKNLALGGIILNVIALLMI